MNAESSPEYSSLRRLRESGRLKELDAAISRSVGPQNVFGIVPRIVRQETLHSDVLAWLLDENGSHGLGATFVRAFVKQVLPTSGLDRNLPIETGTPEKEFPTSRGPIDILLKATIGGDPIVIGIENKIDASETSDQLSRYWLGLRAKFPGQKVVLLFLTPDGRQPTNAHVDCPPICVRYGTVIDMLTTAVESARPKSADRFGFQFAGHYLDMLKVHIMKDSDISKFCLELYEDHKDAWRLIRRHLPSERDDLLAALGREACLRLEQEFHGEWRFSIQKDMYARVWRREWERVGHSQDDEITGIEGAIWKYAAVHLRLAAEPPEPDSRNKWFTYEVRLKLHKRGDGDAVLAASVVDALKSVESFAKHVKDDKKEFTIRIDTHRELPSIDVGADTVVDWIMQTRVPQVVRAIDGVLLGAPSASV